MSRTCECGRWDIIALHMAGGLIHILLVIALISLVLHLFRGRSMA